MILKEFNYYLKNGMSLEEIQGAILEKVNSLSDPFTGCIAHVFDASALKYYIVASDNVVELYELDRNILAFNDSSNNVNELNGLINTKFSELTSRIDSVNSELGNRINEVNSNLENSINTKANQDTTYNKTETDAKLGLKADKSTTYPKTETYTKTEVNNLVNSKANQANTYTKAEVDSRVNVKANSNDVVNLSGNQTIAGVKTFTSNITAPNITTLQNQMNGLAGLVSGVKVPYLLPNQNFIGIKVGANLNPNDFIDTDYKAFTNLVDTVTYLKKNFAISLDPFITIETHSEFNDDFTLSDLPPCTITAGYKFANNLHIRNCPNIVFGSLVLGGNLTVENSNITIIMGNIRGRVVDEYYSDEAFEKSSIVAINSTVIIAGYVQFYPSNDACSIVAKEGSQVIISNSIVYQNTPSRYFAYVESGGKIVSHGRGGLPSGLFEAKTNVAPNTLTPNGMILGSHWG